jgi:hypothetical protein
VENKCLKEKTNSIISIMFLKVQKFALNHLPKKNELQTVIIGHIFPKILQG